MRQAEVSEPIVYDVSAMSEVGRSKVRHVGG